MLILLYLIDENIRFKEKDTHFSRTKVVKWKILVFISLVSYAYYSLKVTHELYVSVFL